MQDRVIMLLFLTGLAFTETIRGVNAIDNNENYNRDQSLYAQRCLVLYQEKYIYINVYSFH